jgi:hypothetical protein
MSPTVEKPLKIGNEITVRISLTFQEAPDVHTLLAMTPVRERGKLVRFALERYIAETAHPAGDVEQQIMAVSTWLRSRGKAEEIRDESAPVVVPKATQTSSALLPGETLRPAATAASSEDKGSLSEASPSISRWLQA